MTRTIPARAARRTLLAVAVLALALATAACGSAAASPSPSPLPSGPLDLNGTTWMLLKYVSPDGTSYTVPSAVTPIASFQDGTVSGSGGCNTFNGPYTLTGDQLTMGPLAATKMACEEPIASVETAYLAAMDVVNRAAILENGNLQLWDDGGKTTLAFVRGS
jgi:heat shock protein HslJ